MARGKTITGTVGEKNFEFDIGGNVIRFQGRSIPLQPLETHVLRILLNNRGQVTSVTSLSRSRRGAREAASAESIREAISSLRQKLEGTGLQINSSQSVGYEIHAFNVPELNRRLSDKVLLAINQAAGSGNKALIEQLHVALQLSKESERQWRKRAKAREQRAVPRKD
ncbi:MAG TPA: helix-turn-helix domain-containing protein [Alphaproteobacteria bacterium]|nr:helix-turn-helix domain-containing protein [Alphaproteobacteria bacterium]